MSPLRIGLRWAFAGIVLCAACGPRVSDTGYVGTWTRQGLNTETTLAIARRGDDYLFRWGRESSDNRLQVRCEWDGRCEEYYDGQRMASFRMRAWVDESSGLLRVECRGSRRTEGGEEVAMHYVDELRLRRNGTQLVSRMIEHDGEAFRGRGRARRVFEKHSDEVVDPPQDGEERG